MDVGTERMLDSTSSAIMLTSLSTADTYPSAEGGSSSSWASPLQADTEICYLVVGIDLSPIQPRYVPPNRQVPCSIGKTLRTLIACLIRDLRRR